METSGATGLSTTALLGQLFQVGDRVAGQIYDLYTCYSTFQKPCREGSNAAGAFRSTGHQSVMWPQWDVACPNTSSPLYNYIYTILATSKAGDMAAQAEVYSSTQQAATSSCLQPWRPHSGVTGLKPQLVGQWVGGNRSQAGDREGQIVLSAIYSTSSGAIHYAACILESIGHQWHGQWSV